MSDEAPKTSIYEILIATLLGMGAIGGGWAAYQASQWGSTALEEFGKSAKTATEGATEFNLAISVASRDADLDVQAKTHVLVGMTTQDELAKKRELTLAKYLYVQQMSPQGYQALGYPEEFHSKEKGDQMPEDVLLKGLDKELDETYLGTMIKPADDKFTEADKIFNDGDGHSNTSTKFGQVQMIFTIALFLGGIGLVVKSNLKWAFLVSGYGTIIWACVKLFSYPWYHAS